MLEQYFVRPDTVDRIRSSWLGVAIERYVAWLTGEGYAPRNVYRRVPLLVKFGAFARERGASGWEELPGHVEAFVEEHLKAKGTGLSLDAARRERNLARATVEGMIALLLPDWQKGSRRSVKPDPFSQLAPGFFGYLREERGLTESAMGHYRHYLRRFEGYLAGIGLEDLGKLSPPVISGFITEAAAAGFAPTTLTGLCVSLRVFLRHLHARGVLARDLSASVEAPQRYRLSGLPRSISWDAVKRMLEAVDQRSVVGRRDYAILLLLVTYGLRAREVAAMTLDDIDWRRERLLVPERKADHTSVYPLAPVVGAAILAYLRQGRPETSSRQLFFRHLAPRGPLTVKAVSSRASSYLKRAGIEVHRAGSHTLRHACVQRLVDAGLPFKSIGDYVGHRSASSTLAYAKIDVEALREVALGDAEKLQ